MSPPPDVGGAEPPPEPPIAPTSAAPGGPTLPPRPPFLGEHRDEPPPPQEEPEAHGPGGPGRAAVIGAAVILAVGLIIAALVLRGGSGGDEVSAGSTTVPPESASTTTERPGSTSSTMPGATTTTERPPPVDPAELEAEITDAMNFVEVHRGLDFKQRPDVELVDPGDFDDQLQAQITDEEIREQAELLSALGMLPAGADPIADFRAELTARVAGYYDAATDTLVIKNAELDDDARQVIVHELVHALDDQHFDLDRPQYEDLDDETAFGFRSVVEGDAVTIERAWRDRFNEANAWPLDDLPDLSLEDPAADYEVPISSFIEAPYVWGERLIRGLYQAGGIFEVDDALVTPPTTSEQVIHPEAFLAGEGRIEVDTPSTDGGEILDEGVLGELMLEAMLEVQLGRPTAAEAASGWGGDWYVRYTDEEDMACLRVDWVMDTDDEFDELVQAFEQWSDAGGVGEITEPEAGKLRFTNCVPPAGGGGGESPL